LQHRLEELRLRDEKRRTDQLLGMNSGSENKGQASPLAMSSEVVQAPVTDLNARNAGIVAPQASPEFQAGPQQANYMGGQPVYSDQIQYGRAGVSQVEVDGAPFRTSVSIVPRAGISNMAGTNLFNTQSRFSMGLGLSVELAQNVALDLGYTYNEYGVGLRTGNLFIDNSYMNYTSNNYSNYIYKQNIIDLGMRFYFLKRGSIVRPYVGGGGAYSMASMNYDPSVQNMLSMYGAQYLNQPYQTNSFLGFVQAGADLNVAKNVSIGAGFRYYQVLSANENQQMNPYGFLGSFYPGFDPQKMVSGGSLARSNFYSILGTVSFVF
jgi:opacity protein-like surface antigen